MAVHRRAKAVTAVQAQRPEKVRAATVRRVPEQGSAVKTGDRTAVRVAATRARRRVPGSVPSAPVLKAVMEPASPLTVPAQQAVLRARLRPRVDLKTASPSGLPAIVLPEPVGKAAVMAHVPIGPSGPGSAATAAAAVPVQVQGKVQAAGRDNGPTAVRRVKAARERPVAVHDQRTAPDHPAKASRAVHPDRRPAKAVRFAPPARDARPDLRAMADHLVPDSTAVPRAVTSKAVRLVLPGKADRPGPIHPGPIQAPVLPLPAGSARRTVAADPLAAAGLPPVADPAAEARRDRLSRVAPAAVAVPAVPADQAVPAGPVVQVAPVAGAVAPAAAAVVVAAVANASTSRRGRMKLSGPFFCPAPHSRAGLFSESVTTCASRASVKA